MANNESLQLFEENGSIDSVGMSQLIDDLQLIINSAKVRVASVTNTELTMMYWHIGKRINSEILCNQRAEYGKQIVSTVSTQLQRIYGNKGFESRSIRRMMQFASKFVDENIVTTLSQQNKLVAHHRDIAFKGHPAMRVLSYSMRIRAMGCTETS